MQRHRKILFLPRWYPTDYDLQNGVFIQKHARAAALSNEVVVLLASPASGPSRFSRKSTGNLTEVILYYNKTSFFLLNLLNYVGAIYNGWRIIRKSGFKPNITHVNMLARPALLALWLKWRYGVPFIISEHWSGYATGEFEKLPWLKKRFVHYAARKAAFITAVSEFHKQAMIRCGHGNDIKILPNVAEVLPDAWKQSPVGERFRYLVVADLRDDVKNVSGVIRAFAEVFKKEPVTELMIVGDGKDRDSLTRLAKAEGVQSVSFLGEKSNEEVLKIIPTAHVLIVNSRIETFSVVTLEAIFSGRPVIATRCGGPEQFINEQNGILIEKENGEQLAEAMIQMKKSYVKYSPERVRSSVPDKFSVNSIGSEINEFYQEAGGDSF